MEKTQEKVIDLRKVFEAKVPKLMKCMPNFVFRKIQRLLHEDDINYILTTYKDLQGVDFINTVLDEYFHLNLIVEGLDNLKESPRVVVASNHPLGGLDGMALIGVVANNRGETLTPVNDFLMFIPNLRPIFIPVNKVGSGVANRSENVRLFNETFESDKTLCYFPFGLCSRKTKDGKIMDLDWKKTFVTKAKQFQRDIVPVHIEGRNSKFFYNLAYWRKKLHIKANLEMAFLVDEFFKQRDQTMKISFGKPIPYARFDSRFNDAQWAEKLRTFSYNLPADCNQMFDPSKDYQI
ncbi:MAG: 1-acyl-sn-glycerol-3-phosphate acyltransferase [Bacteroidales bacterium]|nr:1-acyl-sn-glycerol-3-phosphate acyltransferase [Bacteroidales bacterium]